MLMVIILNEVIFVFRERRRRKKDFFYQFFSERLKAHGEIFRIMTKGGITYFYPETEPVVITKEKVKNTIYAAHEATAKGLLFADKRIGDLLFDLVCENYTTKILQYTGLNMVGEVVESVTRYSEIYYELLRALREKSGVYFIEEIFDSIPQTKGEETKKDNKKREKVDKKNKYSFILHLSCNY